MPAEQLHISHETPELHSQVVQETVLGWSKMEPDLVLLAMETGGQVHTTRMFLSIFSPSVRNLCSTVSVFTSPLTISVPASQYALENLLAVLTTGSVLAISKDNLMEVTGAAACLGIQLTDIQIGIKREKGTAEDQEGQMVKKIPSKRGRKKKSENEKKPGTAEEKSKNKKPKQTVDHDQDNSLEFTDDQKCSKTELDEIMNNSDNIEKEDSSECGEEIIETSDKNNLGNSQEAKSSSDDEFDENKSICSDELGENKSNSSDELDENKSNSSYELDENKSKCSDELDENKSIKPKNKECNDCGKTFSNTTGLKQHRTVHTGEKPFKCDQCDKLFGQKGSLLNHKVIHSGEKPFKCSECDKVFTQKGNMKSHMMKGHPPTEEVPS